MTAELLADHVDRVSGPGPDGLVFTNNAGNPLIESSFYSHFWKPAQRESGVTSVFRLL